MTLTLPPAAPRQCAFAGITDEHRRQVAEWLAAGVSVARITTALAPHYTLSLSAVNTHRLGRCQSCDMAARIKAAGR